MRKIILLFPTIRIPMCIETHKKWMSKAKYPKRVITRFAVNTEEQKKELLEYGDYEVLVLGSDIRGVPYACWRLSQSTVAENEDIIISTADDFDCPKNWDVIVEKDFENFDGALCYKDGIADNAAIVTLPILTYSCLLKLDKIVYPVCYRHNFADNEFYANLTGLGLLKDMRKTSDVVFPHNHWCKNGGRAKDLVDLYANTFSKEDEKTWTVRSRMTVQQRLNSHNLPSSKELSILVPTMNRRKMYLQRLMDHIGMQEYDRSKVEVLVNCDDGEKTIGQKRNELLKQANGNYIVFVDDDDLLSNNAISLMLKGISMDSPDDLGITLLLITDGIKESTQTTYHSVKFPEWYDVPDPKNPKKRIYYRCPNHINIVKRLYALSVKFPEINNGEDRVYSYGLKPYLKREVFINEPIYYYLYRSNKEC